MQTTSHALREQFEAVTGERISALEGIGEAVQPEQKKDGKALLEVEPLGLDVTEPLLAEPVVKPVPIPEKAPEPEQPVVGKSLEWEIEL